VIRFVSRWPGLTEDGSVGSQFLHSTDPSIRRQSAFVYALATGVAVLAWAAWGGFDEVRASHYLAVGWLIVESLLVWFVATGIGLRAIRVRDRRRNASTQSVD
jgi:hypothetical protein